MTQRTRKRRVKRRTSPFWPVILILVLLILLLYKTIVCLTPEIPRLNYVIIKKNDSIIKLLNGETLTLRPSDIIRIEEVSTNICFNHGVRLYSPKMDIESARFEPCTLDYLAGKLNIFEIHSYVISVKRFNKEIGRFKITVKLTPKELIERAQRIINIQKRIQFLEKAHKLYPDDGKIIKTLINDYRKEKRWDKLISLAEGLKKTEENLRILLDAYEKSSRKKGIISTIKELLKINPKDLNLILRIATLYEESGNIESAINYYKMAIPLSTKEKKHKLYKTIGYLFAKKGKLKSSISYYEKAHQLSPKDSDVLYSLSSLYQKTGNKKQAQRYLRLAIEARPEDIENRLILSEQLIKEKRYKEAKKYLREILKKRPDSLDALVLSLKIAEKTGDKAKQKFFYKKLIKLKPEKPVLIYNLGVLEYETGDLKSALKHINEYLRKRPRDPDGRELLFNIYRRLKMNKLALKSAINLLELRPENKTAYEFIFDTTRDKNIYLKLIPLIKKGLKKNPKSRVLQDYLIFVYVELGKDELALKEMENALKSRPGDISLLFQIGALYENSGKIDSAIDTYKKIINLSKGSEKIKEKVMGILFENAQKHEKQGKYRSAMAYYRLILDIYPDNETAQEGYLRARLKTLSEGNE